MKQSAFLSLLTLLLGFIAHVAHAREAATQATVTAVTGSSQIALPDGTSVVATVGLKVSQGAVITTGAGAQLSLQAHDGIVAVVTASSVVEVEKLTVSADGMRNVILNLKSGNVASSLDPARKSTNNFGVRTAKGLAMARGTTFTVSVNGSNYTVSVLGGTVTVAWAGGQSVNIVGNTATAVTTNGNGGVTTSSLSAAMQPNGSTDQAGLTAALTAAAAAVATVATNTTAVTAVINTIAAAAGTSPTASNAVASATAAATSAAVTNTTLVAAAGNGGTTSIAATISTAAVASATAAGNGGAAQLIVNSAANAVVATVGTSLNVVAKALAEASNSVTTNPPISQGQIVAGVNAPENRGTPIVIIPAVVVTISPV